ncbi:hypothetical protein H2201_008779 [Coniosporium apollinis]|uniref:Uncharacterized protein n=1 Tax=Coniosporium apollinis TaxID=61459 RepID=A0ABQ9NFS3_9PEZI|nr:hypothetical protein H2201_008779 [Coniosporium apollinis]
MDDQRRNIKYHLCLEHYRPFTMDEELLERYRAEHLDEIQEARYKVRARAYLDKQGARETISGERLRKAIGADPYQREVNVMAKIIAYYRIASARFIDHVCMSVRAELSECSSAVTEEVRSQNLQVNGDEVQARFVRLLAEDLAP